MRRIHGHGRRTTGRRGRRPDQRKYGARLTPEAADRKRVVGRAARKRAAADRADASYAAADRNEKIAGAVESHLSNRSLEEHIAAGHQRPVVAAVGRLIDADAGFRVGGSILLAGGRVQRVAGRIGGVEKKRSDRVRAEAAGDVLPFLRGIRVKRLIGSPDAAAGCRDVQTAMTFRAVGRQRHPCDAARRDVRRGIAKRIQHARDVRDARANELPASGGMRVAIERRPPVPRRNRRLRRDVASRKRALLVILHGGRVKAPHVVGPEQRALVGAVFRQHTFLEREAGRRLTMRCECFGRDETERRSDENRTADDRDAHT